MTPPIPLHNARRPLVIVGAGGHGREMFAVVAAINTAATTTSSGAVTSISSRFNVIGFADDLPTHLDRIERLESRILGDIAWLCHNPSPYALGVGTSAVRRRLSTVLESSNCEPCTIVHPSAQTGPDVRLADGVAIYAQSVITTNVAVGRHTHINVGCSIQHDTVVGQFVQISPGVFINGDCTIGDDVFLGTGAVITRGCSVGAGATVGAGAVVLHDVPAGATVVGIPAAER